MTSPAVNDVNDSAFDIAVTPGPDSRGLPATDVGPYSYAFSPAGAATDAEDTNFVGDTAHRAITVVDATADFTITATDENGVTGSMVCHPIAGGPTTLNLTVSAT